jgi:hypothetical protein
VSQETLELRILSGLHAMAAAPWENPGVGLSFGHAVDNDVILRDAPFERAEIMAHTDGFQISIGDQVFVVKEGQIAQIDALVWVVQASHASWPSTWKDATRLTVPSSSTQDVASLEAQALEPPSAVMPVEAPDRPIESPLVDASLGTPAWPKRRLGWALLAVALGGVWFAWPWWPFGQGGLTTSQAVPKPTTAAQQDVSLQVLVQLLRDSNWTDRVRIAQGPNGTYRLWGVVDSMDDMDQVIQLLANKTRRIQPQILTQIEFEQRVNLLYKNLPPSIRAVALSGGRVQLQVNQATDADVQAARDLLMVEIPEALEINILTGGEKNPVQLANVGDWSLPAIASVHSGENAYVMLTNGRKVLPGGKLAKLTLSSIEDDTLVLQAPNGQLLRVNR